ncbi:S8 family serine peptidase [Phenylobacterium sp. J367]|uniref:S8 family serine peptidase n=1 Tax=Phenylobacterium sp. J367 TaxID=2898435 RepID=UPI00215104B7|nr:S8 family serine peptidase [Phenylobacterium sp. J367]MCR5877712.1 S8 family serine peptidase [Phenylobacterium sp. J367]
MSLGVSGWTLHGDWKDALAGQAANTVFVIAAGNAGTTQSQDIAWNFSEDPALLVVGSVDPDGVISDFSNRPGNACLLDNGACSTGNKLMNRFLVAPGELILVSDGEGGVTRRSGTSFAAPLVTGAVALLHDRWPWLEQHPHESADIILKSAKDLGAPGVDAVYGWGMLDIAASQSPLDFDDLTFKEYKNGVVTDRTAAQVKTGGVQTTWEADGVYFKLYEEIGDTYRDFAVPMSSNLVGQKSNVTGSQEYFQSYITSRLTGWISGTNFSDTVTQTSQQPGQWSFAVTTGMPQPTYGRDDLASQAPHMSVRMADPTGRFAFSFGHGEGAMVMGQLSGFAQTRDYRSTDGGVNPLLGFASGGPFMNAEFGLTKNTTLSFGAAERTLVHRLNPALTDTERDMLRNVDDYRAGAVNLRLDHKVSDALSFNAGYARVDEANGLLGVQSTNADDLASGSVSHVATVGASVNLPSRMTFAASASVGETKTHDAGQNLATVGGVQTTAYAVALTKQGLVSRNDMFRVAFTQPLTVSYGTLAYTSVDVIDRQTGELGPVSQKFDISVKPRHVAEALYATPAFGGRGEVSFFGRAEVKSDDEAQNYMAGVRLNLNY